MLEILSLSMLISPLSTDLVILLAVIATVTAHIRKYKDFDAVFLSLILLLLTKIGLSNVVSFTSIFILIGHRFVRGAISSIAVYFALSLAYLLYLNVFLNWEINYIILLALIASLSASLMESIKAKPMLILLAVSTSLAVFHVYALNAPLWQIALAFVLSFILSLLALKAKIADESGLMSATLIGLITIVYTDIRYFLVLLTFYVVGSAVTKYRYSLKVERGIAEQAGGARGFANVFSNSLPALFFAMNYGVFRMEAFSVAFTASIATALGDTMASEIGKTADNVYLITNFKKVKPGESGGISLIGEVSAFLGCFIISLIAFLLGVIDLRGLIVATILGFFGVHVDSVLGATLERKGFLNNAGVNLLATLSSGLLALIVC
ncbi:TIGR00297 family protein [Archaeoglobus profundus]|uniref:TIGR00297 family protein n=1 Tax=Archaeoglobus profundus (strain DSM 5631 / JCM 9629 / NBRC 100127 / Av18) TaxID=572546 RepID=D2RGA4_ARCPA|nr:TIGR00297 family protein [Archaeoglobus profundus]ADB57329.1 protein of unknown function DUF92 transmembrane [Archaeoglobus profundus DSM 5631]